jgi:hypothetical protein
MDFIFAASLNVPFSTQAPAGNWSQPWHDACEETSLVMVDHYYGEKNLTKDLAVSEILKVIHYKNKNLGESLDENVDKMLLIINNFYQWQGKKISNPSLNLLKEELAAGRPVIIPVAGSELNNPHFRGPVPYHVLVLKGYDDATAEFIVNDPGTIYGNSYRYSYQVIMEAIHDFANRDIEAMKSGLKYVIFTSPLNSTLSDGSLAKALDNPRVYLIENQTKRHITSAEIFLANGWTWSQIQIVTDELLNNYQTFDPISSIVVVAKYTPTTFEKSLKSGTLIKSTESHRIYLLENNSKRYIVSPAVFTAHGWSWSKIKIVSRQFIESLPTGIEIN